MDSIHQKYKAIVTPKLIFILHMLYVKMCFKKSPKNLQKANFIIIRACKHERARLTCVWYISGAMSIYV